MFIRKIKNGNKRTITLLGREVFSYSRKIDPKKYNHMTADKNLIAYAKSDLVIALAITHHLILGQCHDLNSIFNILTKYTNKYLFVEFMPKGLWPDGNHQGKLPAWYTEEWFVSGLTKFFTILYREQLNDHRILFACKKAMEGVDPVSPRTQHNADYRPPSLTAYLSARYVPLSLFWGWRFHLRFNTPEPQPIAFPHVRHPASDNPHYVALAA